MNVISQVAAQQGYTEGAGLTQKHLGTSHVIKCNVIYDFKH